MSQQQTSEPETGLQNAYLQHLMRILSLLSQRIEVNETGFAALSL